MIFNKNQKSHLVYYLVNLSGRFDGATSESETELVIHVYAVTTTSGLAEVEIRAHNSASLFLMQVTFVLKMQYGLLQIFIDQYRFFCVGCLHILHNICKILKLTDKMHYLWTDETVSTIVRADQDHCVSW